MSPSIEREAFLHALSSVISYYNGVVNDLRRERDALRHDFDAVEDIRRLELEKAKEKAWAEREDGRR